MGGLARAHIASVDSTGYGTACRAPSCALGEWPAHSMPLNASDLYGRRAPCPPSTHPQNPPSPHSLTSTRQTHVPISPAMRMSPCSTDTACVGTFNPFSSLFVDDKVERAKTTGFDWTTTSSLLVIVYIRLSRTTDYSRGLIISL